VRTLAAEALAKCRRHNERRGRDSSHAQRPETKGRHERPDSRRLRHVARGGGIDEV
jgi:hypothetical protein